MRVVLISLLTLFVTPLVLANNHSIPDYYEEPGHSPVRQSGLAILGDHVDAFSGQLSVAHTDLSIPGNGGLDINIVRSYNSFRAGKINYTGHRTIVRRSVMGQGWDAHMGRIYYLGFLNPVQCNMLRRNPTSEDNPVLELPDGSRHVFYPAEEFVYASGIREQRRQPDFVTKNHWIADCIEHSYEENGRVYEDGGMIVTSPEGIRYTFNRRTMSQLGKVAYVVTHISDPHGN